MEHKDQNSKGKTVLLAEDDAIILQMFSTYLTEEGFSVLEAASGQKALEMIREQTPAIVLLDLMMPDLSGFDILEAMQQDAKLSKIPVIVFSNLGQDTDIKRAKSLGVKDYLVKADVTPDVVAEKIRQYL